MTREDRDQTKAADASIGSTRAQIGIDIGGIEIQLYISSGCIQNTRTKRERVPRVSRERLVEVASA